MIKGLLLVVVVLLLMSVLPSLAANNGSDDKKIHLFELFGMMLSGGKFRPNDAYGGGKCAGCTIVTGLLEQAAFIHDTPIDQEVAKLCDLFPKVLREPCEELITEYGPTIINMLEAKETPDAVCLAVDLCGPATPGQPKCRLFPAPNDLEKERRSVLNARASRKVVRRTLRPQTKRETPWKWLYEKLFDTFNNHVPLVDFDNDTFSTIAEFRGYYWRGRDCDDFNADIRPGRKTPHGSAETDYNCNGIHGVNPTSGKAWKEELCQVKQYGLATLGDSASAHFHIPPAYLNSTAITSDTYRDIVKILTMEFDWPQMSASTGFLENSQWIGTPPGPVQSFYMEYLKKRNLCSHRDYQSMSVNGARVAAMYDHIVKTFRRDPKNDHPVIVEYALIGNDVCNSHGGTSHDTSLAEFKKYVILALEYLDTILPPGSHVNFFSLADGSLLYDTMHARVHPLGALRRDVTYATMYDFLNCLDISPCHGWLTTNATERNATTAWAEKLSGAFVDIVKTKSYNNFDMRYFPLGFKEILEQWEASGGQAWECIEPVDGFHPSQIGMELLAKYHYAQVVKDHPDMLPPINPNNAQIEKLFGDQGGY